MHHPLSMRALAEFTTRYSTAILVSAVVITAAAIVPLPLAYDDDVIRFLPQDHPEVQRLQAMADRFGAIHVALVGVETPALFTHDRLDYVRRLTEALRKVPEVSFVTSVTELAVVDTRGGARAGGEGESVHRELVPPEIPTDADALAAIRDDVLSLDYLVGSLVSSDGTSTLLVLQLKEELDGKRVSTTAAAAKLKVVADGLGGLDGVQLHFGGAPFISEAAANGSQRDLARLAPWVCGIIVLLIFISLGSARAAVLALGSVGLGILWTMGLMGWLGAPLTLVSTSLPVILTALGSAYAVHLLVCYLDHPPSVEGMLERVGWPVAIAGLTTMAGFISFLVMDLAPMREFGWQMAAGTGVCGVVALLVIPAVLAKWPIEGRAQSRFSSQIDEWLVALALRSRRRRSTMLFAAALVAIFFGWHLRGVETRMDTRSFFEAGSAPELADRFMSERFSGSLFLQVMIDGDMHDPAVLRQIADFEDRLQGVEGVNRIESITNVMSLVNEALGGRRHVANTRAAVKYHGYLAETTDPAVRLLVDPHWKSALIQVALGGFDTAVVRRVTDAVRSLVDTHLPRGVAIVEPTPEQRAWVLRDAAERLAILTGRPEPEMATALQATGAASADLEKAVTAIISLEIGEEEMVMVQEDTDLAKLSRDIAGDFAGGQNGRERLRERLAAVADPEELEEPEGFDKGVTYIFGKLQKATGAALRSPAVDAVLEHVADAGPRLRYRVEAIVSDVSGKTVRIPQAMASGATEVKPLMAEVSGYPVVQEAMSQSVHSNQIKSVMTSLPLVFFILLLVFRNPFAGLVGMVPTVLTLLVTFGLMGLFSRRLPLDIGSSMLASIALGVGIDYAIHFLWRYRETGLSDAMRTTGRAIVINAAEITAGFVVLAWASIVPMSNFGLLVAETLLVSALATLVLMPALVGWWKPDRNSDKRTDAGRS